MKVFYIAGDTIWCGEAEQAISEYQPTTVVLNAGAAQLIKEIRST